MWFQVDFDTSIFFNVLRVELTFHAPKMLLPQDNQLTLSFYYTWPKDQGVENTS